MKTPILYILSVFALLTIINAKPKPCGTGALGLSWCGEKWENIFDGYDGDDYDDGDKKPSHFKNTNSNQGGKKEDEPKSEAKSNTKYDNLLQDCIDKLGN
ncbi:jg26476 [Pararge aegeria aegeria]|uniref:Jg26476 protein n=1 Tax=Pararge aegeria aegeria TaxID=348720 RepID=A0A8S4RWR4_9NEOP|nr:jg26476 [Pararge aegeria aegeria]